MGFHEIIHSLYSSYKSMWWEIVRRKKQNQFLLLKMQISLRIFFLFLRLEKVNEQKVRHFLVRNQEVLNVWDLFNKKSHIIEIRHLFLKVLLGDNGSHTYNSVVVLVVIGNIKMNPRTGVNTFTSTQHRILCVIPEYC